MLYFVRSQLPRIEPITKNAHAVSKVARDDVYIFVRSVYVFARSVRGGIVLAPSFDAVAEKLSSRLQAEACLPDRLISAPTWPLVRLSQQPPNDHAHNL